MESTARQSALRSIALIKSFPGALESLLATEGWVLIYRELLTGSAVYVGNEKLHLTDKETYTIRWEPSLGEWECY
jgi:hypothetical protein